jgi:hypothetical protein
VTGLLRYRIAVIVVMLAGVPASLRAQDAAPFVETSDAASILPETWPADWPNVPEGESFEDTQDGPPEGREQDACAVPIDGMVESDESEPHHWFSPKWLGLRHSTTHGRHIGRGKPFGGTSWLNRPYYIGGDLGTMWLTQPIEDDVTRDIDTFGGIFAGCDWDHYWGTELGIHRSTPELDNNEAPDAEGGDRLMLWTASLIYYPWGDAAFRPYWRCGIGATAMDYPTDEGDRRDEELWTIPIGVGFKYPIRRWLAARAEFADQLALGNHGVSTQHNLSLTFGLECRFGAHPRSYWPWNPDRHIW